MQEMGLNPVLNRYFRIDEKEVAAVHWISSSVESGVEDLSSAATEELVNINRAGNSRVRELVNKTGTALLEPAPNSLLDVKSELSKRLMSSCALCERRCGVNRLAGEKGFCGVGGRPRYSSEFLHMGEEPELVPSHTVFFPGCTFHCVYCQNWDIAMHPEAGRTADPDELAAVLLDGMQQGSRNANFVGGNPDPNLNVILETARRLGERGKYLPLVWNSNMYTSVEALDLLEGVIDIYLGDFRYGNDDCARELSDVEEYRRVIERNFAFAFRTAEVIVRHLVLPGHLECCTRPIMEWVSRNMPGVYFNLMFQYRPDYRAGLHPEINRVLSPEERRTAREMAEACGLVV